MYNYQKRMRLFSFEYHILNLPPQSFSEQHVHLQKKVDLIAKGQVKKVILLREEGSEFNSLEFARFVLQHIDKSQSLIFIIGAHQGFSPETLIQYKVGLSLSRLTFPHQLVPLIFTEQLYRAETLVENKPYHY